MYSCRMELLWSRPLQLRKKFKSVLPVGRSGKLLLVLASTVNLGFGSIRNPLPYFYSFQDFCVLRNGTSSSTIRGVWILLVNPLYWVWLDCRSKHIYLALYIRFRLNCCLSSPAELLFLVSSPAGSWPYLTLSRLWESSQWVLPLTHTASEYGAIIYVSDLVLLW
jgi:hypothetical protein